MSHLTSPTKSFWKVGSVSMAAVSADNVSATSRQAACMQVMSDALVGIISFAGAISRLDFQLCIDVIPPHDISDASMIPTRAIRSMNAAPACSARIWPGKGGTRIRLSAMRILTA